MSVTVTDSSVEKSENDNPRLPDVENMKGRSSENTSQLSPGNDENEVENDKDVEEKDTGMGEGEGDYISDGEKNSKDNGDKERQDKERKLDCNICGKKLNVKSIAKHIRTIHPSPCEINRSLNSFDKASARGRKDSWSRKNSKWHKGEKESLAEVKEA